MTISYLADLACPRCTQSLEARDGALVCKSCKTDFPVMNKVPFLFAEPSAALGEWRSRLRHAEALSLRQLGEIETALENSDLAEKTRERLVSVQRARQLQDTATAALLKPLSMAKTTAAVETYLALRTRLPNDQGLNTYFPNIFRDWAWGDDENRLSCDAVLAALPDTPITGNVVVLGAGAGRLAYDLAGKLDQATVLAIDFNPLLTLLAEQLNSGESLVFQEFPVAPIALNDAAVERQMRAPEPRSNLHFITADAMRAPLKLKSASLIVTPWLLDIMDAPVAELAARINGWLTDEGHWINFGSTAFRKPAIADCLTRDELIENIEAHSFANAYGDEIEIPYLCSPASRHHRRERVTTLRFDKTGEVANQSQYRGLPDWIVTGKQAVPAEPALMQQAAATRIHAFIMSMIDGQRSLQDMAVLMEQQNLMPADQAVEAIRGFLIKMYDDASRYSAFLG